MEHCALSFDTVLLYYGNKNKQVLVLIDHCHSLMLEKDGRSKDCTEAASTDAHLQLLRRQLPTELGRFMCILIVTQTSAKLGYLLVKLENHQPCINVSTE